MMGQVVDDTDSTEKIAKAMHAVLVPFPAQGHVTPFLQLAKKLVGLGFHITFVNTTHNHDRMMKSQAESLQIEPDIEFVAVSDGLPDDHPRLADVTTFCEATLEMGPSFEDLFAGLMTKSPITCVIHDVAMPCLHDVARKFHIPEVGFATPSAISFQCVYQIPQCIDNGFLPLPPSPDSSFPSLDPVSLCLRPAQNEEEFTARRRPVTCIPGTSPDILRVEDLPTFLLWERLDSFFFRFFMNHHNKIIPDYDCVLLNTFYELEADVIDMMHKDMNPNIYPIGPLAFAPSSCETEPSLAGVGSALWKEDPKTLSWLDNQKPQSVLYVSFGSIAQISLEQVRELAHGLEMSQHAFLWVIRSDQLDKILGGNKEFQSKFSEFVERTRDRALLMPWVPQSEVLSHPSVAVFITHCGWNSTIESISSGIPMLTWPRLADQNTNSRYITHVWKVGMEVDCQRKDGLVVKEEVAEKVGRIMAKEGDDPQVDKIRNRSRELRNASRKAVMQGGPSQKALLDFVHQIRQTISEV